MFENQINFGANIIGNGSGGVALDKSGDTYVLGLIDDHGAVIDGSDSIDLKDLGKRGVELHVKGGDKPIVAPGDQKYLSIDGARCIVTIHGTEDQGVKLDGQPAEEYTPALAIMRYPRSQYT